MIAQCTDIIEQPGVQTVSVPQPDPYSAEEKGDEGGGDGEDVDQGVQLEHEHQLVVRSDKPHEEVGHEQDVQEYVKLKQEINNV